MEPNKIIFFDGVCKFCNYWANFALKHNGKKNLFFAPLQSDFAIKKLNRFHYDVTALSSVVFLDKDKIYTQSSAAVAICKELNWPWKFFYIFIIIPKFLRDVVYNFIAKNRYKWFGKMDACRIPSKEEKDRFLE